MDQRGGGLGVLGPSPPHPRKRVSPKEVGFVARKGHSGVFSAIGSVCLLGFLEFDGEADLRPAPAFPPIPGRAETAGKTVRIPRGGEIDALERTHQIGGRAASEGGGDGQRHPNARQHHGRHQNGAGRQVYKESARPRSNLSLLNFSQTTQRSPGRSHTNPCAPGGNRYENFLTVPTGRAGRLA